MSIFDAAKKGDLAFVKQALDYSLTSVGSTDEQGRTLLHYAAESGHFKLAQYLVSFGAMVNAEDSAKQTPIQLAYQNHHTKLGQFLSSKLVHEVKTALPSQTTQRDPVERTRERLLHLMSLQEPKSKTLIDFSRVYRVELDDFHKSLYKNIQTSRKSGVRRRLLRKDFFKGIKGISSDTLLTEKQSEDIWHFLKDHGFIDETGRLQNVGSLFSNNEIESKKTAPTKNDTDVSDQGETTANKAHNVRSKIEQYFPGYLGNILKGLKSFYYSSTTKTHQIDLRPRRWYPQYQAILDKITYLEEDIKTYEALLSQLLSSSQGKQISGSVTTLAEGVVNTSQAIGESPNSEQGLSNAPEEEVVEQSSPQSSVTSSNRLQGLSNTLSQQEVLEKINSSQNLKSQLRMKLSIARNDKEKLKLERDNLLREIRSSGYSIQMLSSKVDDYDFRIVKAIHSAKHEPLFLDYNLDFSNSDVGNQNWRNAEEQLFEVLINGNRLTVGARNDYLRAREALVGDKPDVLEKINASKSKLDDQIQAESDKIEGLVEAITDLELQRNNWLADLTLLREHFSEYTVDTDSSVKEDENESLTRSRRLLERHSKVRSFLFNKALLDNGDIVPGSSYYANDKNITSSNHSLDKRLTSFLPVNDEKSQLVLVDPSIPPQRTYYGSKMLLSETLVTHTDFKALKLELAYQIKEGVGRHSRGGPLFEYEIFGIAIRNKPVSGVRYASLLCVKKYFTNYGHVSLDWLSSLSYGDPIKDFFSKAIAVCEENISEIEKSISSKKQDQKEATNRKAVYEEKNSNLVERRLSGARKHFLENWNSPSIIEKSKVDIIRPDQDPLADFLVYYDKALKKPSGSSEKKKIDSLQNQNKKMYFFNLTAKGFVNQSNGETLKDFMGWLKYHPLEAENTVLVLPSFDKNYQVSNEIIQVITNPQQPDEGDPLVTWPSFFFVEDCSTEVEWIGYSLGSLSHTINLPAGGKKTVVMTKETRLTRELKSKESSMQNTSTNVTSSFEENLRNELSEDEKKTKKERKNEKAEEMMSKAKRAKLTSEQVDTESSQFSASLGASYGLFASASLSSTDQESSTKRHTSAHTNEDALKKVQQQESAKMNEQSRGILKKNMANTVAKVATKTSTENRLEFSEESSEKSEMSSSSKETMVFENPNVGVPINYLFFQLRNDYRMATYLKNVRIVVNLGREIIKGTGLRDVRTYNLEEFATILPTLDKSDYSTLLSAIIVQQVMKYYANFFPSFMSGNGALVPLDINRITKSAFRYLNFSSKKMHETGRLLTSSAVKDGERKRFYYLKSSDQAKLIFEQLKTTKEQIITELLSLEDKELTPLDAFVKRTVDDSMSSKAYLKVCEKLNLLLPYPAIKLYCDRHHISCVLWENKAKDDIVPIRTVTKKEITTKPKKEVHLLVDVKNSEKQPILLRFASKRVVHALSPDYMQQLRTSLIALQKVAFQFKKVKIVTESLYSVNSGAYHLEAVLGFKAAVELFLQRIRALQLEKERLANEYQAAKIDARYFEPTLPNVERLTIASPGFFSSPRFMKQGSSTQSSEVTNTQNSVVQP